MPSFDIVSEVDTHELANAIDQANREIGTRFDFKGSTAKIEQDENKIKVIADGSFQATQVIDVLRIKLIKRNIDINSMEIDEVQSSGKGVYQNITIREGIEQDIAKKIIKMIKDAKLKVQTSIQGDKLRVTGKKRDDLQDVMALIRSSSLEWPFQFNNFRD